MSTPSPDDDPTHALDDFMRRMRPPAAPPPDDAADLTDLTSLQARLHPERTTGAARPKGGRLRSGQTWDADDVVDVPMVDLPRVPPDRTDAPEVTLPVVDLAAEEAQAAQAPEVDLPEVVAPAALDPAALNAQLTQTAAKVSEQLDAEALAAQAPPWQPDLHSLQLRPAHNPRVLATWQPGAWTGAVREVMDSATEFVNHAGGTAVETYAPHRLLLVWPPQRLDNPLLGRWPQQARLSAVAPGDATEALLGLVPADALLWVNPHQDDVDWALAAEIVLTHEPALRPFQATGLRSFIDAEREAVFARLNQHYQQAPGGAVQR